MLEQFSIRRAGVGLVLGAAVHLPLVLSAYADDGDARRQITPVQRSAETVALRPVRAARGCGVISNRNRDTCGDSAASSSGLLSRMLSGIWCDQDDSVTAATEPRTMMALPHGYATRQILSQQIQAAQRYRWILRGYDFSSVDHTLNPRGRQLVQQFIAAGGSSVLLIEDSLSGEAADAARRQAVILELSTGNQQVSVDQVRTVSRGYPALSGEDAAVVAENRDKQTAGQGASLGGGGGITGGGLVQ